MSQIIKITKSQLKNIVGKVLNEQFTNLSTPQMGFVDPFRAEKARQDANSKQIQFGGGSFGGGGAGGSWTPSPAKGGRTPEAMKNIAATFCGVRGGKIIAGAFKDQPWTSYKTKYSVTDAEEVEAQKSCPTVQTGIGINKPKMQWTKETGNFPLLYGQFGPTIQKLQIAMGMKGDTYFGIGTEKGVLSKAPEYKRQTGVTQEIYNKIVSKPVVKRDLDTNIVPLVGRPLTSPTIDTSKLAQLPNIQGIQSNVSAERRQEIVGRIKKQAITGKLIYKGDDLNPEEQQFLNAYIQTLGGGELSKSKDKEYGQKMVYNN